MKPRTWAAPTTAVVITVGTWLASAAAHLPLTNTDWREGASVFESRCAICHATDVAQGATYGPNLARIGADAGSRRPGLSAEEYIIESITRPEVFRAPGFDETMPGEAAA